MSTSFSALCTDFYVNQKLSLKMDLPNDRETVLHLFDRVRKTIPSMDRFRRFDGELALESSRRSADHRWLAMQPTSIRTGHVNPSTMDQAYGLHRLILEAAPYHLTISPLDVDYLELLFGFDLECRSNHDQVVADALIADSPLAGLLQIPGARTLEAQPQVGVALNEQGDLQAHFEVKTRTKTRRGQPSRRYRDEPISIFLTLRKYGPIQELDDLEKVFNLLANHAETLATDVLVPNLLTPVATQIISSNA